MEKETHISDDIKSSASILKCLHPDACGNKKGQIFVFFFLSKKIIVEYASPCFSHNRTVSLYCAYEKKSDIRILSFFFLYALLHPLNKYTHQEFINHFLVDRYTLWLSNKKFEHFERGCTTYGASTPPSFV